MKRFGLLLSAAICVTACTGCSSPYLPHNAFKYIPEFSGQENLGEETEAGGDLMDINPLRRPRSYFSPDSIRERYKQHISDTETDNNPLPEEWKSEVMESEDMQDDRQTIKEGFRTGIVEQSVQVLRTHGKSDREIKETILKDFLISEEMLDKMINEK